MAKKKKSVKNKNEKSQEINPNLNSPEKTKKSRGSFWVNERESGKWRVLFQNWSNGKKQKAKTVSKVMYPEMGLKKEMTVSEARQAIHDFNKVRKKEIKVTHSQINALKRFQDMKEYNKTHFPPEYVGEFLNRLKIGSDGEDRFKKRLYRCFEIVQEMVVELNLQPHDYEQNMALMISYFKDDSRKYSVSYSKDILWVLNKWGYFFSRKRQTAFEPVGKIRYKTQKGISDVQKEKDGVRRVSKPMTLEILDKMTGKDNLTVLEDHHKYQWVYISFAFGLRPSECDAVIKEKMIELTNGVPTLVVVQTKLTGVDDLEKEKRIPVLCEEQAKALEFIKKGNAIRPTPTWVSEQINGQGNSVEVYDLYCGRKGFTDFMISKGQTLENISLYLGHKNIQTTWKFYKDRKRVDFNPTEFTQIQYKKVGGK